VSSRTEAKCWTYCPELREQNLNSCLHVRNICTSARVHARLSLGSNCWFFGEYSIGLPSNTRSRIFREECGSSEPDHLASFSYKWMKMRICRWCTMLINDVKVRIWTFYKLFRGQYISNNRNMSTKAVPDHTCTKTGFFATYRLKMLNPIL